MDLQEKLNLEGRKNALSARAEAGLSNILILQILRIMQEKGIINNEELINLKNHCFDSLDKTLRQDPDNVVRQAMFIEQKNLLAVIFDLLLDDN